VIRSVLNTVASQKKTLSSRTVADVQAWIDCYDNGLEVGVLLSRIGRAATFQEQTARR
jgi:hypothetical protein